MELGLLAQLFLFEFLLFFIFLFLLRVVTDIFLDRMLKQACAAEMAVRYAALCACRKVHVCHCNSLGGATS